MDAVVELQHKDDVNYTITTCDKDKKDTRRRVKERCRAHLMDRAATNDQLIVNY